MAEQTSIVRSGGARGIVLVQKKALLNTPVDIIKSMYGSPRAGGLIIRKVQVGNPVGDPAFVLGESAPWTGFKGNLSQFQAKYPDVGRGLGNAVAVVRAASKSYSKGPGLTTVGGLVYTRWQKHLMTAPR